VPEEFRATEYEIHMLEQYRGSESILVADDEPIVLSTTQAILRIHGYKVHLATNGQEALEVHRQAGPLDLLLTDVVMPQMSGPELAHALKQEVDDLRCVFMSGYDQEYISQHGGQHIGCDYLRKPFTPEALLKKIRNTLDEVA
jgi:two-component system cell cycle sensor histidine kinase/response regulator CckA